MSLKKSKLESSGNLKLYFTVLSIFLKKKNNKIKHILNCPRKYRSLKYLVAMKISLQYVNIYI